MTQDLMSLLPYALGLMGAGLFAGVLAGLLGVGGGIVVVPALYHIFTALNVDPAVIMHLCVGTSLATIIPTSIRSTRAHHAKGAVDFALWRRWAPFVLAGGLLGTVAASFAGGKQLTGLFAMIALVMSAYLAFGREDWKWRDGLPGTAGQGLMATVIAFFSVMIGIGGGTFSVPALTLFGYPIHRAVGTSAGIGILIAVPGTLGFILDGLNNPDLPPLSLGYVSLLGLAILIPTTVYAAPWGVALAHRLPRLILRRAFAGFLALTAARMIWNLVK